MLHHLNHTWASFRKRTLAHVSLLSGWIWILTFLSYAATTARHVLPADSGEFQLVAAEWGIAHPPGYPLYTVLSALWTWLLPLGTRPFRTSLLSAVLAATTLVLIFQAVVWWAQALGASARRAHQGGVAAALALGAAATFWNQATIANIRMPTLLFTAWSYLALARYRAADHDRRLQDLALAELAVAAGLGIGHHPSLVFVALGWGLYLLLLTPQLINQPMRWLRPAGLAIAAWLIPQLYLPLRGSMVEVALNPSGLATWDGFWNHVLARGFGGDMFAFIAPAHLALRVPLLPTLLRMQFPALILALMGVGWLWLLCRHTRVALSLFATWAIHSFVTITYRAPQTVEYLMPATIPMVLALGMALALWLPEQPHPNLRQRERRWDAAFFLWVGVCLALLAQLPNRVRDFGTLANATTIRDRVAPLLEPSAETPHTTVLADWRWATPLWVLQATEGLGATVDVIYVVPDADRSYEDVWRERADDARGSAVFTTHAYDWAAWSFAPVGGGFRLYPRPLTALPQDLAFTPVEADLGAIRLLGYRWYGDAAPGGTLELQLAWQAQDPTSQIPSFATRLWDSGAALISAADRRLEGETYPGEIRFTRLTHQIPPFGCPGNLTPAVGVYVVEDGEFRNLGEVTLPTVETACRLPKLPSERRWLGLVLGRGPFLRGVDYDTHAGGSMTVYLHWCGPGAALAIRHDWGESWVGPLRVGECQTSPVPATSPGAVIADLARPNGAPARYLGLPLPQPRAHERYLPFGDQMVLVGNHDAVPEMTGGAEDVTLLLHWRTTVPLQEDYAVSVRLLDTGGNWLGMHDMQPGLGAIPTLKWVARGDLIRDPHPIAGVHGAPERYEVVVYERFRLTYLRSAQGDSAVYGLR